jgi:mono/diheme cytochrome c family protein
LPLKIIPLAVVAALAGAAATGPAFAGGFTAEQAAAGETAYNSNCAQCHGKQLEGPDAPGLAGPDVMQNWATAGGLFDFIHVAMPPSAPGQLGDETYLNIIAYIMKFNGAQPGDEPLTADPDKLAAISLPAETQAGAVAATPATPAAPADTTAAATAVPQAFTWGKQLPGGPAPGEAAAPAATTPAVPQAFTWGKTLPTVAAPAAN